MPWIFGLQENFDFLMFTAKKREKNIRIFWAGVPTIKHLLTAELKQLMRNGASKPVTHIMLSVDDIIGTQIQLEVLLIPMAMSPYGQWEPLFHNILFDILMDGQEIR